MTIPFVDLKAQYTALQDSINARIQNVLEHGQYIMGPEVGELEEKLAAYTGAKHCVTCASGTEALLIALMALEIKPRDEVVTTPFTFAATAEMIVLLGAHPVFVDVEPDTCNMDAGKIEAAVTRHTRAIMPVSLYGQPCDMDEINVVAKKHKLPVIEDAAQSFGATYKGHKSCNLSTIGCTSFFPSKPLGCYGDGGALFTNDDALAKAMREIRVHGQSGRYQHTRIGVGGRMDTIQCAVVLAKLERFDWEIAQRQRVAVRYDKLLSAANRTPQTAHCKLLPVRKDRTSVYAQYTIRVPDRARFQEFFKERGMPTAVHYPLGLHQQPAYAHWAAGASFPVSEALAREVVSLPMHPYLGAETQDQIVGVALEAATAV